MRLEFIGQSRRDPDNTQANPARLVNMYREPMGEGYSLKRVLGAAYFTVLPGVPTRAIAEFGGELYAVNGGMLYRVDSDGTKQALCAVADDPNTSLTSNNGSICVVAGGVLHVWDGTTRTTPETGAFADVASSVFWGQRTLLSEQGGRRIQWSGVADAGTYDGLDFASAEARDDNIVRLMNIQGQLWVFGERSIERWYLTAGSDFAKPMSGALIDTGLRGWHLVAQIPNGGFFVGSDGIAYLISGGSVRPVSTRGVETNIQAGTASHVFYYEDEGHKFCVIRYSDRPADVYDIVADEWHERASGPEFMPWAALYCAKVHGDWVVANEAGEIHALRRIGRDGGEVLVGEATSRTLKEAGDPFSIDRITLWASTGQTYLGRETGVGLMIGGGALLETGDQTGLKIRDQAANPRPARIVLQFSRDRGKTWGKERWVSLGDLGDYRKLVRVYGCGAFETATMRLRFSDADDVTIESVCDVEAA